MILSLPKEPSLLQFVSLSPISHKSELETQQVNLHISMHCILCREKQPHKKDRIFFLKIDNHKNKSLTLFC